MRRSFIAAAALLTSYGAAAQSDRLRPVKGKTALVVHSWATCTARYQPARARALLTLDYRTEAYGVALRDLARRSNVCLFPGEQLRLRGTLLFAGGLAESLFERKKRGSDLKAMAARLDAGAPIEARDELEMVGLCVARREPERVASLLGTAVAGRPEAQATALLAPTLQGCTKAGVRLRLGRWDFRSLVALGLYRLAAHAALTAQLPLAKRSQYA